MALNTAFLLMAQYNGKAVSPLEDVCRDYFSHLTPTIMLRKIGAGEIALPVVRARNPPRASICRAWPTTSISDAPQL